MRKFLHKWHLYFETLPDRLYPFTEEIEGRWVRGKEAYMAVVAKAFQTHGQDKLGYRLILYRGTFHLIGAVAFMVGATIFSRHFFGSEVALYVLLGVAVFALTLQEFLLHPVRYKQSTSKGVFDWLSWVVPMLLYVTIFLA